VTVRILHLRSTLGLYGAEGVIVALARETRLAGHHPIVGSLRDRRCPSYALRDRAAAERLETAVFDVAGRVDPVAVGRIALAARGLGCDLVHAHDYKTTLMGLGAAALARLPLVTNLHGDTAETQPVRFYEWLNYRALRFCGAVVAVSRELRERAAPFVDAERLWQIDNGIDIESLRARAGAGRALHAELGLAPETPLVGMAGRLAPEKGHAVMLEALALVRHGAGPAPHLVVAGDGPLRGAIEAAVAARGLTGRVHLLGARSDLPVIYAGLTVLAQPSLREGLPLVVLEAAALGLPIVASAVGAIPEALAGGEAGVLVRPGDATALAAALGDLLRDPARADRLGKRAAGRVAERYSARAMAQRYLAEVYRPLLDRRR
jgi:glycosyltransferase involved in cell wall biosynthesis